jgi:hypothetical protein
MKDVGPVRSRRRYPDDITGRVVVIAAIGAAVDRADAGRNDEIEARPKFGVDIVSAAVRCDSLGTRI